MGNALSKTQFIKLDANDVNETVLEEYAELSSLLRNSSIEFVSDEYYGKAENLLKQESVDVNHCLYQEGTKDGWQVQRHLNTAHVIIKLGCTGTISGFDIDTTGFMDAAPTNVLVEGYVENKNHGEKWITLLPNVPIDMNAHNFFKIQHDQHIYSRIKLTTAPGGGIARFRCYGHVVPIWTNLKKEYNLASANLGAQIVRWTDVDHANKPNILLDNGLSPLDGWLTPRSRYEPRNDFVVIQLATLGVIKDIIIDTTSFIGNIPKYISIEGCNSNEIDPYRDPNTEWFKLVDKEPCAPNSSVAYVVDYGLPVSHIKLTLHPDGGIQQIQVLGVPYTGEQQEDILTVDQNEAMIENEEITEKEERQLDNQITKELGNLLFPTPPLEQTVITTTTKITQKRRKSIELVQEEPPAKSIKPHQEPESEKTSRNGTRRNRSSRQR
ncbi:hypothetical protein G6F70_004478 [Rhizopus microsporus]|uniref:Allantoicase n=2 Tax=Rhizopus TaxID=4842 RepID=A0A367JLT4_RHIAZ|nr:hypothetical protein G6F71_004532 [Rhizopus microsporus]RCH90904.1 Allantoicase [Rhizopus azygosporus]KAG1199949.1 hypothetical protein G6F70_004478 [Rhizopus microsporus]KAG1211719.1 hypothetical protein G6F69_004339 [Rhizopus microsporus]KAG1233671.1 hypothetical protein G6F67_004111 [Rhizopus microsporus]